MRTFCFSLLDSDSGKAVRRLHSAALAPSRRRARRIKSTNRQVQRRISPAESADLVAAFQAGVQVNTLAQHYTINRTTVLSHLKQNAVRRDRFSLSDVQIVKAIRLYRKGNTLEAVAQSLGVGASTVRRALLRNGVELRRRGTGRPNGAD